MSPIRVLCHVIHPVFLQVSAPDSAIYSGFPDDPDFEHRSSTRKILQALGLPVEEQV